MEASKWMKRSIVPVLVLAIGGTVALEWKRVVVFTSAMSTNAAAAETHAPGANVARVIRAEGRLAARPGALVTVGTDFGGTVRAVKVDEKGRVKKGELVAEIAAEETRAALGEASARIHEADVDITFLDTEIGKAERLLSANAAPKDLLDKATHERDSTRARRAAAQAAAGRFAATLAKSRGSAPIDGVVLTRHVEPGEVVAPGARVATICDLSRVRVEAEVDEFDTARMKVGADVTVRAEGYETAWHGKIEEIPDSVGPRTLRPQDPGRPSDTRVLVVKIALDEATPLKLGQRVEVEIAAK